ncbi:MAG TPA: NAD-binding protein [Acidobacteriota bacterium]
MSPRSRILIVGSTPLALLLATQWETEGHAVTVIDRKGADFSAFPDGLSGGCIEGEPLDKSVLWRASIEETDVMVGATSKDDLNLATAIACHSAFHVEHAFAVVGDPQKADTFAGFGVQVVCPTLLAAAAIVLSVGGPAGATAERDSGGEETPTRSDATER